MHVHTSPCHPSGHVTFSSFCPDMCVCISWYSYMKTLLPFSQPCFNILYLHSFMPITANALVTNQANTALLMSHSSYLIFCITQFLLSYFAFLNYLLCLSHAMNSLQPIETTPDNHLLPFALLICACQ